jgi:hypothetical protein
MFANKTKNNEKSPDFIIYLSNEQESTDASPPQKNTKVAPPKRVPQAETSSADDDGVPM